MNEVACPRCKAEIVPLVVETPESKREPSKFTPESLGINRCEFCLRPREMLGLHQVLEVHHKMPVHLGGEDVKTNVLVLCTYCHKTAHQRHVYLYEHFRPQELQQGCEKLQLETRALRPEISIPLISNEEFPVYQHHIDEWTAAYPAVDALQALRAMRQWCLSNPRKRKTKRGVRRFITSWLERLQNKGGNLPPDDAKKPTDGRPPVFPK